MSPSDTLTSPPQVKPARHGRYEADVAHSSLPARSWPLWVCGLATALSLGAGLRLAYVDDIEYKCDEAWILKHARCAPDPAPLQWVGIPASIGIRNPAMGTWMFRLLSVLTGAQTPVEFARAVQVLNIAALVLLAGFALWIVPRGEREPWLWATALGALNPLAVIFQRKIWPPSILPILVLAMLIGWWYRNRRSGAFLWGLMGVVIGQIHLAGFFLTGGFAAWAALFERRRLAWLSWLAGCSIGALPMLPWAYLVLGRSRGHFNHAVQWIHVAELKFWARWFTEPFGLGIEYSLESDFGDFLRYPLLGGRPTYLVGALHAAVLAVAAIVAYRSVRWLRQYRNRRGDWFIGRSSTTAFTENAALWGFGILLTLSTASIHRHYLVVAFPLTFVWLARLALAPAETEPGERGRCRALLVGLCMIQFLLSAAFLDYIHANPRQIHGDYGIPYRAQPSEPIIPIIHDGLGD